MTTNAEVAEILHNIADLLDLQGEKFKPEAYRRAARSVETLAEDLKDVAARNELRTIPGIGEAIEGKVEEYLRTGRLGYYERLKREVPNGLLELMHLPGVGPKTARRFWAELGIEGPAELADAIAKGRLDGVKGFGAKKIEQIRAALAEAALAPAAGGSRRPIEVAYPIAERLVRALAKVPGTDRAEAAGSFRRRRETVGDLDILVTSSRPETVFDTFSRLPDVRDVRLRGGTKETVVLTNGLQVDLRVVEPAEFGAALLYFTGSKDHNVHLRSIARDRGLKVNEYGVFRGEERVGGRTEEEVYASLGLPWIPPEIREDRGEIEAAARGQVPVLVRAEDLTGDLHVHLPADARASDVDRLKREARSRRLRFLGVVVGGVDEDGAPFLLPAGTRERLGERPNGLTVLRGLEVGPGTIPPALADVDGDYRIVRPTRGFPDPPTAGPSGRPTVAVAHLGVAPGVPADRLHRWTKWARSASAAVEVGPGPERLDSTAARLVRDGGGLLLLPTGIARADDDPVAPIALGFARRAGALAADVLRSWPGPGAARRVPTVSR